MDSTKLGLSTAQLVELDNEQYVSFIDRLPDRDRATLFALKGILEVV